MVFPRPGAEVDLSYPGVGTRTEWIILLYANLKSSNERYRDGEAQRGTNYRVWTTGYGAGDLSSLASSLDHLVYVHSRTEQSGFCSLKGGE